MMKHLKSRCPLLFLLFFSAQLLVAQSLVGDWYGLLEYPGFKVPVNLHVSEQGGGYSAQFLSPEEGAEWPASQVEFNQGKLSVTLSFATYEGTVAADFTAITGTFIQRSERFPLNFSRERPPAIPGTSEWVKANYTKREVYIPMRDGTRLFTSIYTPKDTSRAYPMLITRTPYNIEPAGENGSSTIFLFMNHLFEDNYIVVLQDVRGRFMSEGQFVDVRPYIPEKKSKQDVDDNSDTYDSIDWLVKNVKGNNGRAGIYGVSYDGFYSTMALPAAHPALKAASPQAPVTNWFLGDDWHHNGALMLMDGFSFYSTIGRPRPQPTRQWPMPFQWPVQDNYRFFLELGPIKNVKTKYFGDTIQFWGDLMSHPNYDAFWKARDPRPHLKNLQPAVLTVGGWFDAEDCYGALRTYEAIEKQNPASMSNRLIMGPWFHGQWTGGEAENLGNVHWGFNTAEHYKDVERRFFRHYLHGKGAPDLPEADIFITGANEWRTFDTWPPANVSSQNLYFQQTGGLSFTAPAANSGYDEYVSDPMKPVPYTEDVHLNRTRAYMTDDQRFASRRPDVMVYQTDALAEDVTLTGPLNANLFVSTTGTDADYVVKLIDVFPDTLTGYPQNTQQVPMQGYQMLVRGEVMRGRFRNSFEKPEPFVPGKVSEVKFQLPDVAHTFKRGHRIMIQVQNSWFPLVDRNPQKFVDIYQCSESDFQKATHRIYRDKTHPSHLQVWILK
jgi:putative CocE/NonD family hydrolase